MIRGVLPLKGKGSLPIKGLAVFPDPHVNSSLNYILTYIFMPLTGSQEY
jgi:hypothetical protein